ncbi:E3 ubiquitin-protein ligase TRIM45-like [Saccostrea echinata]|uniref:E3 ubiquitin-protein ligase TRIM45-like n=1 Tax=Saccostrea echinata TaxID=191078 RepID=UPI002A7EE22D|nr:E3 ubiquitin-protein ligase TRIM45-like [Saccostrea echinata]
MATPNSWAQEIIMCDLCDNPTQQFCNSCQVSLCGDCSKKHVKVNGSLTHDIVNYKDRVTQPVSPKCEMHLNQRCEAHCQQCDVPVCMKCVITSHNGHNFSEIPHIFLEKKIEIEKETHEIESTILMSLKKKQREIETSINISKEKFDVLKREYEKEREVWHNEVDTIFNKISSSVESLRDRHLTTLKSHLSKLQSSITDVINTTQENKVILKSNKVSDIIRHESKLQTYRNIPAVVIMKIPSIKKKKRERKLLQEEDSTLVEKLRLSQKRYVDELTTERFEHQNTRETIGDLKQSFQQLLSDRNNLSEKYDTLKSQCNMFALLNDITRSTSGVTTLFDDSLAARGKFRFG